MDARRALIVGGGTAVAATVAVAVFVVASNAGALADSPGRALAGASIVVPAARSDSPALKTLSAPASPSAPAAVTVPAPDPQVVTPPVAPAAPHVSGPTRPPTSDPEAKTIVQVAKAARSWDAARTWALSHGWSAQQLSEWIQQWHDVHGDPWKNTVTPTVPSSGGEPPSSWSGVQKEQPGTSRDGAG